MLFIYGDNRDEDNFKTPTQGAGTLFAATYRTAGKSRDVPQTGTDRPKQSGMG